jgi:hypothetical protein
MPGRLQDLLAVTRPNSESSVRNDSGFIRYRHTLTHYTQQRSEATEEAGRLRDIDDVLLNGIVDGAVVIT